MNRPCEDHNSRDCGVCHRREVVAREALPADCEGELRELAALLDRNYSPACAEILRGIIDRYSGVRPMRAGKAP